MSSALARMQGKDWIVQNIAAWLRKFYELSEATTNGERISVGGLAYGLEEALAALEAVLSGRISQGPKVAEFEEEFSRYVGVKHAVAVNSGSSANLLAMTALVESGDAPPASEVIVPAATFTTVLSPICQAGLKPVVVDVEPDTWNLDPDEVEAAITQNVRAIMVVHSLGCPARVEEILRIAAKHDLKVIEDCCEAHGATYRGRKVGSFGDMATFSFYVAHNMTTGEGGMVLTNNSKYDELLRSLREFGRFRGEITRPFTYSDGNLVNYDKRYVFLRMGYNVRMTDIAASLGLKQLAKLDRLNEQRRFCAAYYREQLAACAPWQTFQEPTEEMVHSYYGFGIRLRENAPVRRADFAHYLESKGIETRAFFAGNLLDQPAYRHLPLRVGGELPVSASLRDHALFIGTHPGISPAQQAYVVRTIRSCFEKRGARGGS